MTDKDRPLPVDGSLLLSMDFRAIAQELREHPSYEKNLKNARSLVRGSEFSLTLVALQAGAKLKEHHAPAPASATVLEGEIEFLCVTEQKSFRLSTLQAIAFSPETAHSVTATKETLLLLTFGQRS